MGKIWGRFRKDKLALLGLAGVALLVVMALCAPLMANGRPLLLWKDGSVSLPFLRFIFSPDSPERVVETILNYFMIFLPVALVVVWATKRRQALRAICVVAAAILVAAPVHIWETNAGEDRLAGGRPRPGARRVRGLRARAIRTVREHRSSLREAILDPSFRN